MQSERQFSLKGWNILGNDRIDKSSAEALPVVRRRTQTGTTYCNPLVFGTVQIYLRRRSLGSSSSTDDRRLLARVSSTNEHATSVLHKCITNAITNKDDIPSRKLQDVVNRLSQDHPTRHRAASSASITDIRRMTSDANQPIMNMRTLSLCRLCFNSFGANRSRRFSTPPLSWTTSSTMKELVFIEWTRIEQIIFSAVLFSSNSRLNQLTEIQLFDRFLHTENCHSSRQHTS